MNIKKLVKIQLMHTFHHIQFEGNSKWLFFMQGMFSVHSLYFMDKLLLLIAAVSINSYYLQGCAHFSEFWLFFAEQVFTLPLYCYEKGNQSTMNLDTKQQNKHTPGVNDYCFKSRGVFILIWQHFYTLLFS